jgi:hypothetical protein
MSFRTTLLICACFAVALVAAEVTWTKCTDHACKVGCKTHKMAAGKCMADRNMTMSCAPTNNMYATETLYNGTTCEDPIRSMYTMCNTCNPKFDERTGATTYSMITGCNNATVSVGATYKFECSAGCASCAKKHTIRELQCHKLRRFSVELSGFKQATQEVTATYFANGDCTGASNAYAKPAGVCEADREGSSMIGCA